MWSVFTQRMPELEQEALIEGLIQFVPRIDVRKWPKRALLLQGTVCIMLCTVTICGI